MNKPLSAFWLLLFCACAHAAPREEWFRNFALENAVANSDLILAVQVSDVTELKMMRGGKVSMAMFEYKFKPVRVLKGVFARSELSLESSDLGIYGGEEREIKPGAFLLIFLGRSGVGYRNSNNVERGALRQSMPPLRDAQDPLLDAVGTLLAVRAADDRTNRVSLLIDGLNKSTGPGAVTLLKSIEFRPLLAAQNERVVGAITRHLTDASPAVREAAGSALAAILQADYLEHAPLRESAVAKGVEALKLADPNAFARAAIVRALGAAGPVAAKSEEAMKQLMPAGAGGEALTTIERAAQFRALADLKTESAGAAVESGLRLVPLDDEGESARAAGYALARVDPRKAAAFLKSRLDLKIAAGLQAPLEIGCLAYLPPDEAIPVLNEVARLALTADEKLALASTCAEIAEIQRDARLVPLLSDLLAPAEPSRYAAVNALLKIDSDDAAKVLRPHLAEEADIFRKLEIAEVLGRHGNRDGYAYAIEHVSEPELMEQAVAALAAIREPQAIMHLKEILETSNDLRWNTAAVRGLGAMGAGEMTPKFLSLIDDLRNPLAPAALIALADLGEVKILAKAREGFASRNDQIVTASARAAGKLLARPGVDDADLRNKLAALLADADASIASRAAALDALLALNDERLDGALAKVVREAKLEQSDLMRRVEQLLRDRKVKL